MRDPRPLARTLLAALALTGIARAEPVDSDASIATPDEAVTLAGTLTLPDVVEGGERFPAVVLLTGSGPQDRDSALFGKRPFVVLAEVLSARGYAVLRCDDRGIGASTGAFAGATIDDFVQDATAAVGWLKAHDAIDPERVFALGHSEGASVAAELASAGTLTGGAVYLGGTALPGHAVLTDQSVQLMRSVGTAEDRLAQIETAHRALMEALLADAGADVLLERTMTLVQAQTPAEIPDGQLRQMATATLPSFDDPWLRRFLEHDPAAAAASSTVPALALFGSLDAQVSDEANAGPMADAFAASGQPGSLVMVLPGKNHLFQNAQTGALREYGALPGDLDPGVARIIADWLDRVSPAEEREAGAG